MDYTCVPMHEFLSERVRTLVKSKSPHTRAWVWGPFGERYAQYEVKVEHGERGRLSHIMLQLHLRNNTMVSFHGQYDSKGKPVVSRVIGEVVVGSVNFPSIEDSMMQILINEKAKYSSLS